MESPIQASKVPQTKLTSKKIIMYILGVIVVVIVILCAVLYFYGKSSTKTSTAKTVDVQNYATISVPSNYDFSYQGYNLGYLPQVDITNSTNLANFFSTEFPGIYTKDNPSFTDYTKKFMVELAADKITSVFYAGPDSYQSHLFIIIYKSNTDVETEDQYLKVQPHSFAGFGNLAPIAWLNTITSNGYTVKNGVYKGGGYNDTDYYVAIFTKGNVRVTLFTGSDNNTIDQADAIVTSTGNSISYDKNKMNEFFAAAAKITPAMSPR
jgi:hypothetical protein